MLISDVSDSEGMVSYYKDNHITLYNGDCRQMTELPDGSVQCVVTSPPYWGLRKYSGLQDLVWGDEKCEHRWDSSGEVVRINKTGWKAMDDTIPVETDLHSYEKRGDSFCSLCGAWKGQLGLEPTPELYLDHLAEICREVKRVMRKDAVFFLNIGDSYASTPKGNKTPSGLQSKNYGVGIEVPMKRNVDWSVTGLKQKDLCLIPFRLAIRLQEDGWWVRSVIIWSKPNPMPESVTDRPTESHEYILLLTKSSKYYWDADAVREKTSYPEGTVFNPNPDRSWETKTGQAASAATEWKKDIPRLTPVGGRNIRSVWEFPTQPYPEAHFAVFPEKLPEICIKAGTPEVGCCSKCGAPWERVTKVEIADYPQAKRAEPYSHGGKSTCLNVSNSANYKRTVETLGWQPTCKCKDATKVGSLVLDPFCGAGTTLWVAKKLGRNAVGYELSEEYCELAMKRNRQQVMI